MATKKAVSKDGKEIPTEKKVLPCDELILKLNQSLLRDCTSKFNTLERCKGEFPVPPKPCTPAQIPELTPQISIKWGDSKCDCLETDDFETMCITICNPYSNITFNDFKIAWIQVCDEKGRSVQNLPNGMPSVQLIPRGPFCFGDIGPCREDRTQCVSREFVLRNSGAIPGKYKIKLLGICFDVCFHNNSNHCFELNLC